MSDERVNNILASLSKALDYAIDFSCDLRALDSRRLEWRKRAEGTCPEHETRRVPLRGEREKK